MSLVDFQQAFAEAVVDPQHWAAKLAGHEPLTGYELTLRELERLRRVLEHRGMAANQLLLQANRMMPIHSALPLTCDWLRMDMAALRGAWLLASRNASVQYEREVQRFAQWLPSFINGRSRQPHPALDALHFELALMELIRQVDAAVALPRLTASFSHEPDAVLRGWSDQVSPLATAVIVELSIVDGAVLMQTRSPAERQSMATA